MTESLDIVCLVLFIVFLVGMAAQVLRQSEGIKSTAISKGAVCAGCGKRVSMEALECPKCGRFFSAISQKNLSAKN